MAPANSKANYKTYEAQARMVRAIVAAHPEVKWNYKEIAACYGSDMSEHALNHRFRKIRAQSLVIKTGRERGLDMRALSVDENELPSTKEGVDQKNIAKYFGQSTADGIQFQFRAYKKDAETLRAVHASGGDPANCLPLSGVATPSRGATAAAATTPSSRARARGTTTATPRGSKRPRIKRSSSDDEDEDDNGDGDEGDGEDEDQPDHEEWSDAEDQAATPSRRPARQAKRGRQAKRATTPRRRAAARASATIARLGRQESEETLLGGSSSAPAAAGSTTTAAAPTPYRSIFGDPGAVDADDHVDMDMDGGGLPPGGLTTFSLDPFMATGMEGAYDDGYGDGEI